MKRYSLSLSTWLALAAFIHVSLSDNSIGQDGNVTSEDFLKVVESARSNPSSEPKVPSYTFPTIPALPDANSGATFRSENASPVGANGVQQATAVAPFQQPAGRPSFIEQMPGYQPPNSSWTTSGSGGEPPSGEPSVGSGLRGVPTTLEYGPNALNDRKITMHRLSLGYDAIWLKRQGNDTYPFEQAPAMGNLGTEFSGRYMLGVSVDDTESTEFIFTGPFHWQRENDPLHWIDRTDDYTLNSPIQRQSSQLSSYEYNHRWTSDGLSSTMSGWRVIDYDERLLTISPHGQVTRRSNLSTSNLLLGYQFGGDMARPISQRLSLNVKTVYGGFLNFPVASFSYSDNGVLAAQDRDRGTRLAGLLQLGANASYRIGKYTKLNVGYEMWYIPGMATASCNSPGFVTPASTIRVRSDEDVMFHGTVFGIDTRF